MASKLPMLSKVAVAGLATVAIALWTQWLSGDPAYPKFPPGPVIFLATAGLIFWGTRWWWTPSIGTLISLFTTAGWFVRVPQQVLRLTHPGSVGNFAPGIFLGALLLIVGLVVGDAAGIAATVQNYRRRGETNDGAKMACRLFGGIFVLMGVLVIVGGAHTNKYHNLMHLTWGVLAVIASFLGTAVSKRFCIGSGVFYLSLGLLGFLLGNHSMSNAWHLGPMLLNTGDHVFHLVIGSLFLAIGLISGRERKFSQIQRAGS